MLLRIIQKEIVSHVLSLRFAVTFVLFMVLVFASVYVSVNSFDQQTKGHDLRVRDVRKRLTEVLEGEDSPGASAHRLFWWEGKTDIVPMAPLAWVGQGVQSAMPLAVVTKADRSSTRINRGTTTGAPPAVFRIPDFVYIVSVVLSLLAILFLFDGICGEKESGTLRLILTNAVPRHAILLGKWIGGYLVLIVPFLLATAGAFTYAWARGALPGQYVGRLVFLVFVACLYIAVFFNLSLFVSTTTARSSTSLLVCLLIWVVLVLAIPNMAPVTAKILAPTPSIDRINAEKHAIQRETDLKIGRLTLTTGEIDYGQKIQVEEANLRKQAERLKRRWDQYYDKRRRRQADVAATLGRLSPSTAWTYASVALTNTGIGAYERFNSSRQKLAEDYHDTHERIQKEHRSKTGGRETEWPRLTADQLPRLKVQIPDSAAAVDKALVDVMLLIIANVIFFMLAFVFFLRYDAR